MKECFGNYMEYPICQGHNRCEEHGCFSKTSIDKGPCDCLFKGSCHLVRQKLQSSFRENYGDKIEDCDFYKMIKPEYDKRQRRIHIEDKIKEMYP